MTKKQKKYPERFSTLRLPIELLDELRKLAKKEGKLLYRVIADRFPEFPLAEKEEK